MKLWCLVFVLVLLHVAKLDPDQETLERTLDQLVRKVGDSEELTKNWEASDKGGILQDFLFTKLLPYMRSNRDSGKLNSNKEGRISYNELHNLAFHDFNYKAPEYNLDLDPKKKRNKFNMKIKKKRSVVSDRHISLY